MSQRGEKLATIIADVALSARGDSEELTKTEEEETSVLRTATGISGGEASGLFGGTTLTTESGSITGGFCPSQIENSGSVRTLSAIGSRLGEP